ncbi:hypothetical protein THAOC_32830 [Thalassiosira oceanica]|uniref:Uncharacterized protein n=1 Tax=Thalassiosira oceanica TaxID=159749 RepID=K0RNP5_THAOC|nr:hypothetical protein THAOC_32830 [Thalassiosira oceanica]|eukprot:EJK48377.1 hypothetical protein THAOC_32830 [Thalassiosira oceanica]
MAHEGSGDQGPNQPPESEDWGRTPRVGEDGILPYHLGLATILAVKWASVLGSGPPGTPQIQQDYGAMDPLLAYVLAPMHLCAFYIPRGSGKTTWEPTSTSTSTATPCFTQARLQSVLDSTSGMQPVFDRGLSQTVPVTALQRIRLMIGWEGSNDERSPPFVPEVSPFALTNRVSPSVRILELFSTVPALLSDSRLCQPVVA